MDTFKQRRWTLKPEYERIVVCTPEPVSASVLLEALEEHPAAFYEIGEGFAAIDDLIAEAVFCCHAYTTMNTVYAYSIIMVERESIAALRCCKLEIFWIKCNEFAVIIFANGRINLHHPAWLKVSQENSSIECSSLFAG